MKQAKNIFLMLVLVLSGCEWKTTYRFYESDTLKIEQLTKGTFRHISYLSTADFGKVSCNGMIVIDQGEALVFDTPTDDSASNHLINWIHDTLKCKTIGIVVTHFHNDCLGGLKAFHEKGIPSYALSKTIELAKLDSTTIPQKGFKELLEIKVGNKKVLNQYFGEGHTYDNIVCYVPEDKVLFGGCLIKALEANKGFLGDANTKEWANTVKAIKTEYKDVKVIIPGHGMHGGKELLNYTIELFEK